MTPECQQPLITPHTHLMPAVDLFVRTQKISLCAIVDYVGNDHQLLGLESAENTLQSGANALLEARRKLGQGISIYECPDFWRRREPTLYHDVFVSTGLFELAAITRTPMLFVISRIDDDGIIRLQFERPNAAAKQNDSIGLAHDFIAFCQRSAPQLAGMRIGITLDRARSVNQLKNFCILSHEQRRSMV